MAGVCIKVKVKWEGIPEMIARLDELEKMAIAKFAEDMNAFGEDAKDYAKGEAHVMTGKLRGNMKLTPGNLEFTLSNRTLRVSAHSSCNYALCNEYGSRKMAPRPFMKPTVEWAAQGAMVDRIARSVREVLG